MAVQNNLARSFESIPGPRGSWLWGSAGDLQRDRLQFIVKIAADYGPLVKYRLGPMTMVSANSPEGVQRVLQDNNPNYSKRLKIFAPLRWTLGNGLLTNDGESWLRQRRLMQPAFHRQHIARFGDLMVRETQAMLERWEQAAASGQTLDVAVEMMRLTLVIVTQALFSTRISDDSGRLYTAITTLLEDVIFRFDRPFYPSPGFPTPHNRRYKAALRDLDAVIYDLIRQRRQSGVQAAPHDLLGLLLAARDEQTGEGMNDRQLRDELITLFMAGHETTANALAWTFFHLAQAPAVLAELQGEVDQTLAGRPPAAVDLPQMGYTRAVIEEAMRIHPPVWITNRLAEGEDVLEGYHIPAGTIVAISPYVTHRLPGIWPEPEKFDPRRFITPEAGAGRRDERPRYAYFPFGGGPRQCIGNGFAMTEAQLILALVVQRFRLRLAQEQVEPEPLITLRPLGGLKMFVEFR